MSKLQEIRERLDKIKKDAFDDMSISFLPEDIELAEEFSKVENAYFQNGSGIQNQNSPLSSVVGILGEIASQKILEANADFVDVDWLASQERLSMASGSVVFVDCDLRCKRLCDEASLQIEVKTIQFGQTQGQVLVQHANKYKGKGVTHIFFVHVMQYKGVWKAGLYNLATIEEVLNSPVEKNGNNADCYTVKN